MALTKSSFVAVLGIVLFAVNCAHADDSPEDVRRRIGNGNPVDGKDKAALCKSCHGEDSDSASNIPKLAGQYADYIQRQIHNFQEGTRTDPTMANISATLTNRRDLADISAYFASQNQMKGMPTRNDEGEKLYLDKGCLNCHGEIGKGKPAYNALFPVIGGQHKEYLIKQMKDFKTGARDTDISGIMGLLANQMTDSEIEAVAEFLSGR
ncbi:MAG: c-type cytochrome [Pseudomonadota bacterium]